MQSFTCFTTLKPLSGKVTLLISWCSAGKTCMRTFTQMLLWQHSLQQEPSSAGQQCQTKHVKGHTHTTWHSDVFIWTPNSPHTCLMGSDGSVVNPQYHNPQGLKVLLLMSRYQTLQDPLRCWGPPSVLGGWLWWFGWLVYICHDTSVTMF